VFVFLLFLLKNQVSLVAGAVAGIAGALVSSPADLLLTKQQSGGDGGGHGGGDVDGGSGDDEISTGTNTTINNPFEGVFAGVGVRCLFFAASISVQFLLYDYFRTLLGVSPSDLSEGMDVFADRLSFYKT
jgi:hypothetical protein